MNDREECVCVGGSRFSKWQDELDLSLANLL